MTSLRSARWPALDAVYEALRAFELPWGEEKRLARLLASLVDDGGASLAEARTVARRMAMVRLTPGSAAHRSNLALAILEPLEARLAREVAPDEQRRPDSAS